MIGEFAISSEEVARILEQGGYELDGYESFLAKHCQYDDGYASARFVEFLVRDQ
jgi:CDP-glycerol glycerophosphotransferase (TagB/SpsB family)